MNHFSKKQKGIGLIEVLVAVLVSAIGIIGLMALQTQTMRASQDTYNRSHAVWVFNDVINRIRANEYYASNYAVNDFTCIDKPEAICSTLSIDNDREEPDADLCTPLEFAQFELWEAVCPHSDTSNSFHSSSDYILAPLLSITCVTDGCPRSNSAMQVTLSWQNKIDTENRSSISEVVTP